MIDDHYNHLLFHRGGKLSRILRFVSISHYRINHQASILIQVLVEPRYQYNSCSILN